jgi:hypothetical protein
MVARVAKPLGISTVFVANRSTGGAARKSQGIKRARVAPALWQEKQEAAARESRSRRFRLLDQARRVLPENKRLNACMRATAVGAGYVLTMHDPATGSANYRGLCRCADGKLCAVCAAQIGEGKRAELAEGVETCVAWNGPREGGAVYMVTYTCSHGLGDDLDATIKAFTEAKREMRQARAYREAREAFGNPRPVVAWETTWSPLNGWHYHVHELLFVLDVEQQSITAAEFEAVARREWKHAAARHGLKMNEHGFDFQATRGAVADYIAKFGREPARRPWGVEDEATKSGSKSGRVVVAGAKKSIHLTPFQLLGLLDEGITTIFGFDLAGLFREYAAAVKGKPQIRWSPGLRKALGLGAEKTDEQLVEEAQEGARCLGMIPAEDWPIVVGNDARADLLEQVRSGDFEQVRAWLAGLGVRYLAPLPEPDEG